MIVHCPKCGYSRKPTDTAPSTECPACGIIFEKFLTARKTEPQTPPHPKFNPSSESAPKLAPKVVEKAVAKTTSCPACGGMVAYGAKTCPHCGKSNPAPKPATKVTKKHLIIAAAVLGLMFVGLASKPRPMPVEQIVRDCSKEIGLNPDSNQPVSMLDIRLIDACLNRHGISTKK